MLVWEGKGLDLQEVLLTEQAVEIDAQGVGRQLGIKPSTQAPESMGMVDLDVKLLRELAINGLDDLADPVNRLPHGWRQLPLLVTTRQGTQPDAIVVP